MNIKSLLLGSAAALAVVSGAQAADAIVAAEPEPMEYVRVCDAFGTGYFYIPGTETCLKIGGYVRAQIDMSNWDRPVGDEFDWNMFTRGALRVSAKNDSEIGTIGSYISLLANGDSDYVNGNAYVEEAYITAGGFKIGYMYNYWDAALSGETDLLGSNRLNAIGYEYASDAFTAGIFVDELTANFAGNNRLNPADVFQAIPAYGGNDNIGIEAQVAAKFGVASVALLGGYDFATEDGAVRLIATADLGPGKLGIAGIYSSGANAYYDMAEWTIAAEYAVSVTEKLKLTPAFQYFWNYGLDLPATSDFLDLEAWKAGVTVDYAIADGLALKTTVNYSDIDGDGIDNDAWTGFVRLQRSF
ncbi:MAG: porin [Rhizobium sp.]|nr:porin [Rhizobium sp.]